MIRIHEEMIDKLSKSKEYLIDAIDMWGLTEKIKKLVTLVNEGR